MEAKSNKQVYFSYTNVTTVHHRATVEQCLKVANEETAAK